MKGFVILNSINPYPDFSTRVNNKGFEMNHQSTERKLETDLLKLIPKY